MNLLDIDVQDSIQDIVDAYTKVYGVEHRDVIEKRMNRICYVMYNDVDGMSSYLYFLKNAKQRELAIKFLDQIGIDVSKQQERSYAEDLDEETFTLISNYIGGYWGIEPRFRQNPMRIKAWGSLKEDVNPEYVEEQKIEFINFIRGEDATPITKETFQAFCETDEYKEILSRIEECLQVHGQMSDEYDAYLQEIAPYQQYVDDETKRREDLETSRRNILYEQIAFDVPPHMRNLLPDEIKTFIDEKSKALFSAGLGVKSYIEYFSQEDEHKLSDPSISDYDKDMIYWYRRMYFQNLGVEINKKPWDFETDKEFYEYCIGQEHIKKLMPSVGLAKEITQLRTKEYEQFQKDFIYGSQDFIENVRRFGGTPSNIEAIYTLQKDKKICITDGSDDQGFMPILFYTVKSGDGGKLDYIFLHEAGHAIEAEDVLGMGYRSGFDYAVGDISANPYNSQERKYERLNETITDIFAIEARQVLHEQDTYIFEPRELIDKNVNDYNTHSIVKDLLTTFLDRYREPVVRARLFGDMQGLYSIIGEKNFEELNDVVNRVDSLKGLVPKLRDNQNEEPVVIEYHKQLARLEQIYANMENYQSRQVSADALLESAVSATEGTTRTGQINDGVNNLTHTLQKDIGQEQDNLEDARNQ